MKFNVSPANAPAVIGQFTRWLPAREDRLEKMLQAATHGLTVEIRPVRLRRSLDQNARYWKIVTAIADEIGDTKNGVHEDILCEFHGADLIQHPITGETKRVPKGRSHNLRTPDFSDLMEIAERWAALCGAQWDDAA